MVPPAYGDYRLPHGRHGLSREAVAENQRWRLIGAASEVLAERRVVGLTARLIARRAGVSGHTFYEHFADVEEVVAAGFALAAALLVEAVGGACARAESAGDSRVAALGSALSFGAEEPGLAALMRTEVGVAMPSVAAERERLVGRLAALAGGHEGVADAGYRRAAAFAAALAIGVDRLDREGSMTTPEAAELGGLLV